MTVLSSYFERGGLLAAEVSGYVARDQQLEMACVVEQAIGAGSIAFVEAGTGTGKTFAYLVPLFLSGRKALVSTGTKTLQDQLHFQDLPLLRRLFPGHRIALLKGRSNYLCPHRLGVHIAVMAKYQDTLAGLVNLQSWSHVTNTGDLAEVPDMDDRLLSLVTSTRDNCLGPHCPRFEECPLYRARRVAQDADIVVVNHHLLFANLALREDTIASVLPVVDTIIVDEAHLVPETARQFLGASVGSRRFSDLIRDLRSEMFLLGNDDPQFLSLITQLESTIGNMVDRLLAGDADFDRWLGAGGHAVVEDVDHALASLLSSLAATAERSQGLENARRRAQQLADDFVLLTEPSSLDEYVHWVDTSRQGFNVHLSPVDIAGTIGGMLKRDSTGWVFSSATLCVEGSFEHIRRALGVEEALEESFSSPFDFEYQVRAWLPEGLPRPGTDQHTRALVEATIPILKANSGRTFFLFTSYRAMDLATQMLSDDFAVQVQGSLPRQELLARFRRTEKCILLATHSFWQGVDVRGAGLTCLIIDKLPFASPDEPLVRALMQATDAKGGNAFMDYLLPQAVISLKQGFGRLIRDEADRGLFVIGDPRVHSRSYGNVVLASLPEMEWVDSEGARLYMEQINEYPGN